MSYRIPVKVRHEMEEFPRWRLGLASLDELEGLVKSVALWGFSTGEESLTETSGQFVGEKYHGSDAYFEIVLHKES